MAKIGRGVPTGAVLAISIQRTWMKPQNEGGGTPPYSDDFGEIKILHAKFSPQGLWKVEKFSVENFPQKILSPKPVENL